MRYTSHQDHNNANPCKPLYFVNGFLRKKGTGFDCDNQDIFEDSGR